MAEVSADGGSLDAELVEELVCKLEETRDNFSILPAEILVYIFCLLPTIRDKAKLRYVSRRIRLASETPLLWTDFVWPFYGTHEERCVSGILKACGGCIKLLSFPNYMPAPSKLVKMLHHCRNVTKLSLGTCMPANQLEKIVLNMSQLQMLEVHWKPHLISPLLLIAAKLQLVELTMYRHFGYDNSEGIHYMYVEEYVNVHCTPPNFNVVTKMCPHLVKCLVFEWMHMWNPRVPAGCTGNIKFYDSLKVPLNVSCSIPDFQLQFGQSAKLPFIKPSKFRLLGFDKDLLILTDCTINSKKSHKAFAIATEKYFGYDDVISISDSQLNTTIHSLNCVTHFDASNFNLLFSGHLEQLSVSCPHLLQLSLQNNPHCLKSLAGLRSIAKCSPNLQGLNLSGVHIDNIEDHLELWKILGEFDLTNLVAELCIMHGFGENNAFEQKLICLLKECLSLKVLECNLCTCEASSFWISCLQYYPECLLFGNFSSLVHCGLYGFRGAFLENLLSKCEVLTHVKYVYYDMFNFLNTPAHNPELRQLCIEADNSVIGEHFLDTVSSHGKLEHVVLSVESITVEGIQVLIKNSSKLITFHMYIFEDICKEGGKKVNPVSFTSTLKKAFPGRKLFAIGGLKIVQGNMYRKSILEEHYCDVVVPLWSRF